MTEPLTADPTLDEVLATAPDTLSDHVGAVRLRDVPRVLALYDAGDPDEDEPAELIAWVFTLPGHGPLVVRAANPRQLVHAASLESVAVGWAAHLGGDLTTVTPA
ncbi:hypothetical protein [Actinocatenispora rupis]|nr:hypothetical protein [Actinocatenispora rupis]